MLNKNKEYFLIGSRALNYWFPEFHIKETTDWDVISAEPIPWAEHHCISFLNNYAFTNGDYISDEHFIIHNGVKLYVVNPKGLAIIKRSHLHRNLSFGKHITHWHKYLVRYFENNTDYIQRLELTKSQFKQEHPKLNVSVSDFFDDYVTKKYDHDYLHELVAYSPFKPLYKRLQDDGSSAWCKKEHWDTFTKEEKLQCVAEEAYVIALERFIIPSEYDYIRKKAYTTAVAKICTTLCSGWFRDFAIDNYPEVLFLFDKNKFLNAEAILQQH